MNKVLVLILFSLLTIGNANLSNEADAKEITNLQWKKSVATGKKLSKFRETVTSPALGEKAWKITLLPRDCGRDKEGDYSDCKNNGRDAVVGHGGGDRARSEYSTSSNRYTGEKWISVSIFIPTDFKSVEPVSTSLFQIYEWGNTDQQRHPRVMLRVKGGNLEPRYFAVNGMDSQGLIYKHLKIDDMRGKWTTIIFHTKMSKDPDKGFVKMYVNDVLYNHYRGRTGYGGKFFNKFGIYHSWISRWNDEVHGEYPTQIVYYDNLFRTNSKEKLLKLIQN
ncbi:heparin lyase I family protein [Candidatus Pelagibacter sp. HIMB1483]|uniref:heparin lyase I family protein n=1 Tax=Candidatus Pelagibacter sp. HIMB1483 TaxID=3415414 RepID=UPI003F82A866